MQVPGGSAQQSQPCSAQQHQSADPPCICLCRYELCNKYGIYLMDEANFETHGFDAGFSGKDSHPAAWPEWHDAIVSRGVRMVGLGSDVHTHEGIG